MASSIRTTVLVRTLSRPSVGAISTLKPHFANQRRLFSSTPRRSHWLDFYFEPPLPPPHIERFYIKRDSIQEFPESTSAPSTGRSPPSQASASSTPKVVARDGRGHPPEVTHPGKLEGKRPEAELQRYGGSSQKDFGEGKRSPQRKSGSGFKVAGSVAGVAAFGSWLLARSPES